MGGLLTALYLQPMAGGGPQVVTAPAKKTGADGVRVTMEPAPRKDIAKGLPPANLLPTNKEKKIQALLAAATLRIHANRTIISKREVRLLSRFTGANPHVALVGVPSLPFEVSDLEALRAIADQITGDVVKAG